MLWTRLKTRCQVPTIQRQRQQDVRKCKRLDMRASIGMLHRWEDNSSWMATHADQVTRTILSLGKVGMPP